MSARHTSNTAGARAEARDRLFDRKDNSVGRQILHHRSHNPVRTSAGFCPSCDCPIDAMTGECGCSA